ncbi:hypothetical protein HK097_003201 [Rhizophlyctis rosea]|uniref:Uncharacterized protein n=1 Tax=Rhizophlyctis rosea TaxID=64517 RepID=A0AAD5SI06_9FUNG|nr:hypothetical protein HK097_003201 [Rhizophlyctis rosea]
MRFPKAISVGQVRLKKTLRELDERGDRAPYRVATIGYQSEWGVKDAMRHYETLPDSIKAAIPPPSQENFMRSASDALGLSPGHIFAEAKQPKVCPKLPDSVFLQISTFVTTGCAGSPVLAVDMGEKAIAVGLVIGGSQKENHNVAISFNDPGIVQMLERNGFSGRSA